MSSTGSTPPSDLFLIEESAADREARVKRIRDRIAAGGYEVSSHDVADSLVAFFRRDFVPRESGNPDFDGNSC